MGVHPARRGPLPLCRVPALMIRSISFIRPARRSPEMYRPLHWVPYCSMLKNWGCIPTKSRDRLFFYTTCGWMMWNWLVSALALDVTIVATTTPRFTRHPAPCSRWRNRNGSAHLVRAQILCRLRKTGSSTYSAVAHRAAGHPSTGSPGTRKF